MNPNLRKRRSSFTDQMSASSLSLRDGALGRRVRDEGLAPKKRRSPSRGQRPTDTREAPSTTASLTGSQRWLTSKYSARHIPPHASAEVTHQNANQGLRHGRGGTLSGPGQLLLPDWTGLSRDFTTPLVRPEPILCDCGLLYTRSAIVEGTPEGPWCRRPWSIAPAPIRRYAEHSSKSERDLDG